MKTIITVKMLKELEACKEAIEYAQNYETFKEAWADCNRGDWMLWLLFRIIDKNEESLRKFIGTKVKCARLVQHLMKDKRSLDALDVAERYSKGIASRKELDTAAAGAAGAAGAAYADAADAAAAAGAAYAADTAAAGVAYAADAADAADAAADAADADAAAADAAADDAHVGILRECASIIREDYPDIEGDDNLLIEAVGSAEKVVR